MFKLIIAIAALVVCSWAWAEIFDSNWLYEECDGYDGKPSATCAAYYASTVDTTQILTSYFEGDSFFCMPENFTHGIGIKIWKRYMDDNPAQLTKKAIVTVNLSLQEAYPPPCDD